MKILKLATMVGAAVAVFLAAATALAQYYTPLRYDLRMSSPAYIPGGTLQFGPADRPNPYAFGQPQYGNLGLTGNLRFGQSFQGNVPYNQQGDQLGANLPSLKLSDFRRDSYGAADIGPRSSYGAQPEAYFPGSGSVTNLQSAMYRFAPAPQGERAPYTIPGLNTPVVVMPTSTVGTFYTPTPTPTGTGAAEANTMQAMGIAIPQATLNWLDALIAGKITPDHAAAQAREKRNAEEATAAGAPEATRPPYSHYGAADDRLLPTPDNILNPQKARTPAPAQKADAEGAEADSALYWTKPTPPSARQREAGPTPPTKVSAAAKSTPQAALPPEEALAAGAIPGPAEAAVQVRTYADCVERGHAAMKQGAFEKAEALYDAAVTMEPNRPAAFFGRVSAMLAMKSFFQASVVLQRELARHPDWTKLTPDIRLFYSSPEVHSRVVSNLQAELQQKPDDMTYNLLMGYVYFAGGAREDAVAYLEKAARARGSQEGAETAILKAIRGP